MSDRHTAIYGDQIDLSVAGAGLGKDGNDDLEVKVDDSTIEILSDTLEVKDLGITNAKIADDTIAEVKLDIFNAPTIGYYMKFTSNGLEWTDLDNDSVLEDDFIFHEIPSGLINSTNTNYTLANTPVVGTVQIFLNGLLQAPGSGLDYTVSGTGITFTKAPRTNSDLYAHYIVS